MLFSSIEMEHWDVRMRVRMERFAKVRRDARVESLSIRGLAKRYQTGRDTVRQALSNPLPPARKTPVRPSPRLDPVQGTDRFHAERGHDRAGMRRHRHAVTDGESLMFE